MSLPEKNRKLIALETDLLLSPEDFQAMSRAPLQGDRDLAGYLVFLSAMPVPREV
jgi:hypothetical protein